MLNLHLTNVDGIAAADTVANNYFIDTIGNKTDASSNTVGTASLVALLRYIIANLSSDADITALLGALNTAAATGAVDTSTTLMGYLKQLITEGIVRDALLGTPATDVSADIAAVKVDTAATLVDTGTTLPTLIGTPAVDISTDISALSGTLGAAVGASLSADIAAVQTTSDAIEAGLAGGVIIITADITSSAIPNNTQTGGAITGTASANLLLEEITINTDATGLAAPTNIEISTDNVSGLTGAAAPIYVETVSSLGANTTIIGSDCSSYQLPYLLESGAKLYMHGDDAAGTGAGVATVTMKFRRLTAGASIVGNDLP